MRRNWVRLLPSRIRAKNLKKRTIWASIITTKHTLEQEEEISKLTRSENAKRFAGEPSWVRSLCCDGATGERDREGERRSEWDDGAGVRGRGCVYVSRRKREEERWVSRVTEKEREERDWGVSSLDSWVHRQRKERELRCLLPSGSLGSKEKNWWTVQIKIDRRI